MAFYFRAAWGAANPAECPAPALTLPVSDVFVHHTATDAVTGAQALELVRTIQRWHVDGNGWVDIAYCWLVDQAGDVYAGREWRQGAHTYGQNRTSVGIAWIGDGRTVQPSAAALDAIAGLIRGGRSIGAITPVWNLAGHRDAPDNATECPGDMLEAQLPTIRRYVEENGPVTATEEIVAQLYRTFCLREGDPGGIEYWAGEIDAGKVDAKWVALDMIVREGFARMAERIGK